MGGEMGGPNEVLGYYLDTLNVLWGAMEPVLGDQTTELIFQRALELSLPEDPGLKALQFCPSGVSMAEQARQTEPALGRESFLGLTDAILQIVELLTGEALVPGLRAVVQQREERFASGLVQGTSGEVWPSQSER